MKREGGFTLIEVMIAVGLLAVISGALFALAMSLSDVTAFEGAKVTTMDQGRIAMNQAVRELRHASRGSINWAALPAGQLSYRACTDLDGNWPAVDVNVDVELSPVRTVRRDLADLNNDGRTATQLIIVEGGNLLRVIADGLALDEDANGNGVLDAGEDRNGNNRLERGLWFAQDGPGIQITIQTERSAGVRKTLVVSELVETVVPRN